MILIGSRALVVRAPFLLKRKPQDFDFICYEQEYHEWINCNYSILNVKQISNNGKKVIIIGDSNIEFEFILPNSSSELLFNLVISDPETIETSLGLIPNLDLLFTLKSSHRYLKNSPHFWKNLSDYHLLKNVGCKVRNEYQELLSLREKETYNYSHPKLNQSKSNFFADDNISYIYDHDDIHKSVKTFDKPAYTYFKKDDAEVQCDKKKFFSCSREIQLASVVEESAVLAIERSLVPHPGKMSPEIAWKFAFSKVCTSISSGWWREFAYENALEILKLYPINYWDRFQTALLDGKVANHK